MALKISISSYVSGGFTNPVIWRLYETGTGVLVDDHQELGPHGVVYNFSWVNNIRDIVYTVKMYDQPGGVGVGNLIKSHDITVSTSTLTFDSDIEIVVDGGTVVDPVSGTSTSPPIPALEGKDYYVVERGIGQLLLTRDVEVSIDNTAGNGTFTLLGGNEFNPGDIFIIKIRPQFIVNPPGSQSVSSIYKDVVLITGNTILSTTDFGKLFIVDGNVNVVTLQLPIISSIIDKVSLWIASVGTTHINVVIKAALGETITASGVTSNTFILSRATKAEVINLGGVLYGLTEDNDLKRRGQVEWGYAVGINRLLADGTEYVTADYPGLKKAMDNMEVGTVQTYTNWNTSVTVTYVKGDTAVGTDQVIETKLIYPYKGYFALSVDGTHFRVPDLRNKFIRALKFTDVTTDTDRYTQGPGGYQIDDFKKHSHLVGTHISGRGPGGAGREVYDAPDAVNNFTTKTGGVENRPENIGQIPLIII